MLPIRPQAYKQFGAIPGNHFFLITNSPYRDKFVIDNDGYVSCRIEVCDASEEFPKMIGALPRPAHMLVISPDCLFSSPSESVLGAEAKLLVIPCNSTPISLDDIKYALQVMEETDVVQQQKWADNFFEIGNASEDIRFIDETTGTEAIFEHLSDDYEWFEQLGMIEWGGQQFSPAGEISVLPLVHGDYSADKRLKLHGEITWHGLPLVHSGKPSFLREDQEYIYRQLKALDISSVIAQVENGTIVHIRSWQDNAASRQVLDMLSALFKVDSRYRIIWEIGFGSNTTMHPLDGNKLLNEVYGHKNGCVHWGLGLTPWTQYHIDLVCPRLLVRNNAGKILAGGDPALAIGKSIKKITSTGCPCLLA